MKILLLLVIFIIIVIIFVGCKSQCGLAISNLKSSETYRRFPNNYYDQGDWMKTVFPFIGPFATRDEIPPQERMAPLLLTKDICKSCVNQCKIRQWEKGKDIDSKHTLSLCKRSCDGLCNYL